MKDTFRSSIPTKKDFDELEDTACLESIKAVLEAEYAKPENERDEALLEEAWATFTEITGMKTSFTNDEIDKRIKDIIDKNRE